VSNLWTALIALMLVIYLCADSAWLLEEPEKKHRRRHTILLIVWIFAIIVNIFAFAINLTKCCIKLKEKGTQVQCLSNSK
jgi:heme/copper-type cytochrome/quinol oxidase subunit 2